MTLSASNSIFVEGSTGGRCRRRNLHLTAMVAELEVCPSIVTLSGYTPVPNVEGTIMFICTSPMKPGVRRAKETVAAAEPIFAVTTDVALVSVSVRVGVPSLAAGETGPEPVKIGRA